jgi:hypothetical protein
VDLILSKLAEHGPLGLIAACLVLLLVKKDRDLTRETAARIADAKDTMKIALDLQGKTNDAVGKLSAILDELRKRGAR